MAEYRLNIQFLDAGFGHMLTQPGVSRTLHWFKKGAPPGIAGGV